MERRPGERRRLFEAMKDRLRDELGEEEPLPPGHVRRRARKVLATDRVDLGSGENYATTAALLDDGEVLVIMADMTAVGHVSINVIYFNSEDARLIGAVVGSCGESGEMRGMTTRPARDGPDDPDHPLQIECPRCVAQPRQPCRSRRGGALKRPHAERSDTARKLKLRW